MENNFWAVPFQMLVVGVVVVVVVVSGGGGGGGGVTAPPFKILKRFSNAVRRLKPCRSAAQACNGGRPALYLVI